MSPEGLTLAHTKVVYGTISMLQRLQPKDVPTELLFVGTDRFEYFTVSWDASTNQLRTEQAFHDQGERHLRDSQSQNKCLVDPTCRFIIMHVWEGVLSVLRMPSRRSSVVALIWIGQARITELFVRASTFLHTQTGHPKIALLYQTRSNVPESRLASYRLTVDDRDAQIAKFEPAKERDLDLEIQDPGATLLIPVAYVEEEQRRYMVRNPDASKAHMGGLIVVGETLLVYVEDVTHAKLEVPLTEANVFVAWECYDVTRYFLADDYGSLHLLTLSVVEGSVVTDMKVTKLSTSKTLTVSRPSCLVYLDDDTLFVGSHYGDSQLLRVNLEPGADEYNLMLVQTFPNIGPILDFAIMDMGNHDGDSLVGNEYSSGQARLVTGSGVHGGGSLRSVRSGVGLEDVGILADMENVRGLFPLSSLGSEQVDTLLVSFLTETRVFRFDSTGEVEEFGKAKASTMGIDTDRVTVLARNLPGGRLLHISPKEVCVIDTGSGDQTATWQTDGERIITDASANDKWILLSLGGTTIVSFSTRGELKELARREAAASDQVACLHVSPHPIDVGIVGFWGSGSISLVDLATLEVRHSETLRRTDDSASVPRDLLLAQVLPPSVGGMTLFVALEDGFVTTFSVSRDDYSFSGRKSVVLGTRHAKLFPLPQSDGTYNLFATSEHSSLIFGSEGRIVYSAVTAEDAICVCPFSTPIFPGAVVVATEEQIKISQIDTERRTHVKPLHMGETIRRIAWSPTERVFVLGCIARELENGEEIISSSIRLVDEVVFDSLGKPFALEDATVIELPETIVRAELQDSYGQPAERFLVGTSYLVDTDSPHQGESRGRIIALGVDSERSLFMIANHSLRGNCRSLQVMGDKIIAALTKTVVVFQYNETSTTSGEFIRLASYRTSTYPVDLAIHDNMIAVGDLMKSITLVEFGEEAAPAPATLVETARHYQSAWVTAVSHVEGDSWLTADADGNLVVLRQNKSAARADDRKRLEITAEFNLGESVNRIRKIDVTTSPNAPVIPKAFLATVSSFPSQPSFTPVHQHVGLLTVPLQVEGSIYFFGTIAPHAQDLLMRFQQKLASVVSTPGGIDFKTYRSFRNRARESDAPFRFVDGELIERFLDMDEETQKTVCAGLGPSVEDMCTMVEDLKRMH